MNEPHDETIALAEDGVSGKESDPQGSWSALLVPAVSGLLTSVIVLICIGVLNRNSTARHRQEVRVETFDQLAAVRGAAEKAINQRVYVTSGLRSYVSVNPELTEQEFASFAKLLMEEASGIRSITWIKGEVIEYVFPREGNENAIGLNIFDHPDQGDAARRAVETRLPFLTGPIELKRF